MLLLRSKYWPSIILHFFEIDKRDKFMNVIKDEKNSIVDYSELKMYKKDDEDKE